MGTLFGHENNRMSYVGVADCDQVVTGQTDEEVLKWGAEHGKNVHGMKDGDFTPEFIENVKGLIVTT